MVATSSGLGLIGIVIRLARLMSTPPNVVSGGISSESSASDKSISEEASLGVEVDESLFVVSGDGKPVSVYDFDEDCCHWD